MKKKSGKKREGVKDLPCQKNDELTLEIIDMGTSGEGIGRIDGYTLFVKDALVGDTVRVKVMKTKKQFGYARLLEIIAPSEYRVDPVCSVARQCGGCQLQHCSYEKQLSWKQEKVLNCIKRIGGLEPETVEPILGMDEPYHYRNKAQFPVGMDKDGNPVAGFYAGRSHTIIPCTDCKLQHPCNQTIVETVLQYMKDYSVPAYEEESGRGLIRHILTRVGKKTGEIMVCLVINGRKLPKEEELVNRLLSCVENMTIPVEEDKTYCLKSISLNYNQKNTNVILGEEIRVLYGEPYIEDYIGDVSYQISPLSFYQVNPEQTKKLYQTALDYADLKGGEVVWDLYCGIGTISLFLAKKAKKVCGVEIVPQAIEDARRNADRNHMDNVEFFVGAAEDVVPEQYEKSGGSLKADVVTLDPPRKGCDEKLLDTVLQMGPSRIVYVSCDPATLARDLKVLCAGGYALKKVRACDMFGMTGHVESVCLLSKKP